MSATQPSLLALEMEEEDYKPRNEASSRAGIDFQLTDSKEMVTSVLQLQGTVFCKQSK